MKKKSIQISLKLKHITNLITSIAEKCLKVGLFEVYIAIMGCLLLGCQSHYTLIIIASPDPNRNIDSTTPSLTDNHSPLTKETESALTKPLSITPGNFIAEQNKGGAMVNVLLNLNLVKPVSTSTDTNLQLHGIPGIP